MTISNQAPTVPTPDQQTGLALEQARAAIRAGDVAGAERLLMERLTIAPTDVEPMVMLAHLAVDQGQSGKAMLLLRRAVLLQPAHDRARLTIARLLQAEAQFGQSLAEIEAMSSRGRATFEVRAFEAALCGLLGDHERELAVYEGLVADQPSHPALLKSYGDALKTVGRMPDAINALRRAVAARPDYGEAYWTLANFKTYRFEPREITAMRKALNATTNEDDALHLQFALGRALEERGEAENAFQYYAAGNQLRSRKLTQAQTSVWDRVNAAIALFDHRLFDRYEGCGHQGRDPIFIVGLQRSGSTLIEQILASHPLVEGTSELIHIERLWARIGALGGRSGNPFVELARLDGSTLATLGEEYLKLSRPFRRSDRPLFIDKLPANWLNVGLIRLILPNARIIDARRHPLACGMSNFKQHYATGVTYAYSLESIGRFYADYVRLMDHFDHVQSGMIHRVINERLIEDPEAEVRRLLDFVGVPFDPSCLNFHENSRAIRTPSAEQVRRPINRDGVDSWRMFEPWIDPLRQALGPALQNWET